jgi:outer membrane protein TolC
MKRLVQLALLVFMTVLAVQPAQASASVQSESLLSDWELAIAFEPEWLAAIASRDAAVEAYPLARAQLLPQVGLSAQRSRNDTESSTQTILGPQSRNFNNYPSINANIQVRQALVRPKSWASLAQSAAQVDYAEKTLESSKLDLALRLIGVYTEWSAAVTARETVVDQIRIQKQLTDASIRQYDGGDATRVDVLINNSKTLQLQAQLAQIDAEIRNIELMRREITGSDSSKALIRFSSQSVFQLFKANRLSLNQLLQIAMDRNRAILAQKAAVEVAVREVQKAKFDHYPTADLYATRSISKNAMDNTIGTEYRTSQIGIQLSFPMYSGGAVESQSRKASAALRANEQELLAIKARIRMQVTKDYHTLETSRKEVEALLETLRALTVALDSATKGVSAGISVYSDVLSLQNQIASINRSIAKSTSDAINAWARLMVSTDRLSRDEIASLDTLASQTFNEARGSLR